MIDAPEITRWTAVDETPSPRAFIEYLDVVSSVTGIQRIKQQTFDRLQVREGDHLLDVGCGAGDDVRELAQLVGNTGRVVGFDVSARMIEEARLRSSGLNLPIEFCLGDADRLDFPDETFTGCRIDRVLVHLDDPLRALAEMVRVLRPGGRLVAFDFDWETLIVDAPNRALTRRLANFFCDQGPSRRIGRQLRGLFSSLALTEIDVAAGTLEFVDYPQANRVLMFEATAKQAVAAGLASEDEADRWLQDLETSHALGRFFAALTGFCVSGRKSVSSAEPASLGEWS
jgi:ubiquinone/menaquinone biosynthesis C-methylase UbiE